MAIAKKVPAEFSIELTLSKAEAETLLRVTEKIGGCSYDTGRKHVDAIGDALRSLSVKSSTEVMRGTIDIGER